MPRRVLKHLVVAHGLGPGSRVIVGGDDATALANLLGRLGMEVDVAGFAPMSSCHYDAAVWLHLASGQGESRSLLSGAALARTAEILGTIRPLGHYLGVTRTGANGHAADCLTRQLAIFPGENRLVCFRDRVLSGLFSERPAGVAMAAWQSPAGAPDPGLWRRRATVLPAVACCCAWAADAESLRRAA